MKIRYILPYLLTWWTFQAGRKVSSPSPGDVHQLNERFRIDTTGSNLMSAFMGAATATLYPDTERSSGQNSATITSGTQLERELMDLIEVLQNGLMNSPGSFIDSEFEEGNLFPWTMGVGPERIANNYGRPTARVLPIQRTSSDGSGILPRPTPVYPPNYRQELTSFQQQQARELMEQEIRIDIIPQQRQREETSRGSIYPQCCSLSTLAEQIMELNIWRN